MKYWSNFVTLVSVSSIAVFGLSACVSQQSTRDSDIGTNVSDSKTAADKQFAQLGFKIGSGGEKIAGYHALFDKHGSQWKLTSVTKNKPSVKDYSTQELLVFSNDLKYVQPDYETSIYDSKTDTFVCWTGVLRTKEDNAMTGYNPCESSLTGTVSFDTAAQVIFTAVTFGAYSLTGTSSRNVAVDKSKVIMLLQETNAMRVVQETRAAAELDNYHHAFERARTSQDFDLFIQKYSSNDPKSLVPQAISMRAKAFENEELERRQLANAVKERQKLEDEKRQQAISRIQTFRRILGDGSQTNCGPVLEIKGELVKVYFPLANYGNEHWLRREEIYPPTFGCRFLNGRYISPGY